MEGEVNHLIIGCRKRPLVGVVNNILDSNHVLLKNAKDGSFHFHHQR